MLSIGPLTLTLQFRCDSKAVFFILQRCCQKADKHFDDFSFSIFPPPGKNNIKNRGISKAPPSGTLWLESIFLSSVTRRVFAAVAISDFPLHSLIFPFFLAPPPTSVVKQQKKNNPAFSDCKSDSSSSLCLSWPSSLLASLHPLLCNNLWQQQQLLRPSLLRPEVEPLLLLLFHRAAATPH